MKAHLTRIVYFCAAHRYHRPEWSDQRNREEFGKCANDPGHGHNYECSVTVTGKLDESTSMIMKLSDLDSLLERKVIKRFDHDFLNEVVDEFGPGKQIPTAEALAIFIWNELQPDLPAGVSLGRVRVSEDATLYADYFGESDK
jgi:6-pyruvoyltetrahydropterin/6-carboxytetrahydropterin synthase